MGPDIDDGVDDLYPWLIMITNDLMIN